MQIGYENSNYSPFPFNQTKFDSIPFEILDGSEEIQWQLKSKYQEFASHTYSHFYTLEKGQTKSEFEDDCDAMKKLADGLNHQLKSIVFPRNQINEEYLEVCANAGIKTFRGNQESKSWANSDFGSEGYLKRAKRLGDAFVKVEKTQSYSLEELKFVGGLLNIPANRFFRPVSNKKILEKKKIERIKNEMTDAALSGKIYHLWWHPHNFSGHTDIAFSQLESIIEHYKVLKKQYDFESLNMSEIGERKSK